MKKKTIKNDGFDEMCHAIGKYVEAHGGKVLVIGGIEVSKHLDFVHKYTFHIDFTGRPPKKIKL